jgi:hypothetical protein
MANMSGAKLMSWAVSVGLWPGAPTDPHFLPGGVGPRVIPVTFDFTAAGSNGGPIADDLVLPEQDGVIGSIQGVFIDNSQNAANNFTLSFPTCGQTISVPKNYQMIMPIFEPTPLRYVAKSAGLVLVPCLFVNMPVAPMAWPSA